MMKYKLNRLNKAIKLILKGKFPYSLFYGKYKG